MDSLLGTVFLAAEAGTQEGPAPETHQQRMSYAAGVDAARNFRRLGLDLDWDMLLKGVRDVSAGGSLLLSEADPRAAKAAYQNQLKEKQAEAAPTVAEANKKAGAAFLEENKGKEGVVTLPSGLQYKVLKAGSGKTPKDTDTVEYHFRGTLIDGTEFENTYRKGRPVKFPLRRGIIAGWSEALKLMPAGSTWELFVPPQLAYGEKGTGRYVGPNATLIYQLELVAIQ